MEQINKWVMIASIISVSFGNTNLLMAQTFLAPKYPLQQFLCKEPYTTITPKWSLSQDLHSTNIKMFDSATLPFFCKMEHKIEKNSKIAFRFRIGDLNYVNKLENKR